MTTIASLHIGELAYISEESLNEIPLKLLEMGCLPGAEVKLIQIAPLNDPLYICVNGSHLAIRKETAVKIQIIKASTEETRLRITIHEGRKRQIRKMFDYTDNPVKYLQRIRIGSIRLGSLPIGKYRLLSKAEINANKPPHLLHRKKH